MSTNTPKLQIIALYLSLCGGALLIDRIDFTQFVAATGPFVGYLVGNGVTSATGKSSEPAIGPKP